MLKYSQFTQVLHEAPKVISDGSMIIQIGKFLNKQIFDTSLSKEIFHSLKEKNEVLCKGKEKKESKHYYYYNMEMEIDKHKKSKVYQIFPTEFCHCISLSTPKISEITHLKVKNNEKQEISPIDFPGLEKYNYICIKKNYIFHYNTDIEIHLIQEVNEADIYYTGEIHFSLSTDPKVLRSLINNLFIKSD